MQVTILHPLTGVETSIAAALLPSCAKVCADRIADAHAKIAHYGRINSAAQVASYRASLDKLLASQASINSAMSA